ncbi:sodium:proton antiporter, partial [Corynebacterium ulcerans]
MTTQHNLSESTVRAALARVEDPEIGRPITEIGMVKSIVINGNDIHVEIYLTIAACPMKNTLTENTRAVLEELPGVGEVSVSTDVMSDDQRRELRQTLRGSTEEPVIPFAQPDSTTRVFAVASGKGGVGKSSMTVNLATALASKGLKVGVLDADIYGHSVPGMMGSEDRPHAVDDMIMPPQAHGVKLISIAHFVEGNAPVVWRGPMLHRAIQQFLADVFWGDLDILLLDLPPGTGDIAISVAQLVPNAELLVVTTPQAAAAEVAERAGSISIQTHQRIAGVIENMSAMVLPDGTVMDVFGSGGGEAMAERLRTLTGANVPLLGSVPLDPRLREGGDAGV